MLSQRSELISLQQSTHVKMATVCYCLRHFTLLTFVFVSLTSSSVSPDSQARGDEDSLPQPIGVVQFNNPEMLETHDVYTYDISQEAVDAHRMGGIVIQDEAKKLAEKLRMLSNDEMRVTSMQGIFDSMHFSEKKIDLEEDINEVTSQVAAKIKKALIVLKTNKLLVENLYRSHLQHPLNNRLDCCGILNSELRSDDQYKCNISEKKSCDLIPASASFEAFNPGRNVTEVFQQAIQLVPSIKWQYLITTEGIHNEFPAHNFNDMPYAHCKNIQDHRHREEYVWTSHPYRKNVILLIDHGMSLSANQLITARATAKYLLSSLNEWDRIAVLAISDDVKFARLDGCLNRRLVPATNESQATFSHFIDNLEKTETNTNHSVGLRGAFEMIHNSEEIANSDEYVLIAYISRGLLSALTDAKEVLRTIGIENSRLNSRVIINTYALIDEGKPIMYEKTFLLDIAEQWYDKFQLEFNHTRPIKRGQMKAVNTTQDLGNLIGDFYKVVNKSTPDQPHIFLPKHDQIGRGMTIAVTWPCFNDTKMFGIVGLDVHAAYILEPVTYYTSSNKDTYAFLIDPQGFTVMHPSLERPILTDQQPMYTDISHFEFYPGFDDIRQMMLENESGTQTLEVPRKSAGESHPNTLQVLPDFISIRYVWKQVTVSEMADAPFVAVIRTIEDGFKFRDIDNIDADMMPKLVYHRLDLFPTDNSCMHLKEYATLDSSTLFLSPSTFTSTYKHLSEKETKRNVQEYLAYLNGRTRFMDDPRIKAGIENDVAAVSKINDDWLRQFRRSNLNDFIVRRYVATPSGVFQMFPGTLMNKAYDPTKRDWYTRALQYPGKVVLTAPYLDKGGAGYIVTVSHTIYEGKRAALHGPFDRVVAVMGIDMTLGYFYKLVIEQLPVCERNNIRCFIMDDRGYLITHRSLIEPNGHGPLEQQHITHKEPLVANDILSHQGFVLKKLCNNYNNRTIQRFYQFNTSINGVLTNLVHGEHCSRYQITPIPGTNSFFGIVNQTCSMITAFCPCSRVDRLCLNCQRMEQHECECPCECSLNMNFCTGGLLYTKDINPSCSRMNDEVGMVNIDPDLSKVLAQCYHTSCTQRRNKYECLGVMDCEWCALENDGINPLSQPFCSTQRVCFAGVLGAGTPYHDEIKAGLMAEEPLSFRSTPVGPVAGGIMGCFLALALGIYCYRHHVHRSSHQYISSLAPDNHIRMSHLDNELEEIDPHDDANGHTNQIVLVTFDDPASISPYRVSTTYRRPPGGESDHGYSTMTPHEDSEQASTACLEPIIVRDRYRPASQVLPKGSGIIPPPPSHSRRSQSPTPPQTLLPTETLLESNQLVPGQTVLPSDVSGQTILPADEPHRILANVTVHMVDSH